MLQSSQRKSKNRRAYLSAGAHDFLTYYGARLLGAVTAKGSKGRCCAGSRCVFACSVARAEDYTLGTLSSNLECRSFISSASFVDCIMTMQSPRESTWRPHSVDLASSCGRLIMKLHVSYVHFHRGCSGARAVYPPWQDAARCSGLT